MLVCGWWKGSFLCRECCEFPLLGLDWFGLVWTDFVLRWFGKFGWFLHIEALGCRVVRFSQIPVPLAFEHVSFVALPASAAAGESKKKGCSGQVSSEFLCTFWLQLVKCHSMQVTCVVKWHMRQIYPFIGHLFYVSFSIRFGKCQGICPTPPGAFEFSWCLHVFGTLFGVQLHC